MKGNILHITTDSVVIRADNEQKFEVAHHEFKSQIKPNVGDEVDFDITDDAAHSVYILRQSATMDDHIGNAKTAASKLYNQAKGNLNEENLNKAKDLASTTAAKAKESFNNIDFSKASNAVKSINLPASVGFKIHNKFAVLVLVLMFISMILPIFRIFNESQSYFKLVESTGLQTMFLFLTLASLLMGLPRMVSRILSVIFIIALCVPIYDGLSFLNDMRGFSDSVGIDGEMMKQVLRNMKLGLPLLLISTLIFAVLQVLPWYQTNEKFLTNNVNN